MEVRAKGRQRAGLVRGPRTPIAYSDDPAFEAGNGDAGDVDALDADRFATPGEVATMITLLASERTANVTGANYVIDGSLIKTT